MISTVQEDTRNLPLTTPPWATIDTTIPKTAWQADIRLLIARTKWPVPAVKWWAMQELAALLTNDLCCEPTEKELYRALEQCGLETEVVELLFVFWLAKQAGYVPKAVVSSYIRAQSLLSSLILWEILEPILYEGLPSNLLALAPRDFQSTADFQDAQGREVPRIFLGILENLEKDFGLPFVRQYAFEWANTASLCPDSPFGKNIGYFYGHPTDQMTGQFVNITSHRG